MTDHDSGRRRAVVALLLTAAMTLVSCGTTDTTTPPPDPADTARITVDVTPDWVDAPWTLAVGGATHDGRRDSTFTVATPVDCGLAADPLPSTTVAFIPDPPQAVASAGDSLVFRVDYRQVPWERTYDGAGQGGWYGLLPDGRGGAFAGGRRNLLPRLARLDRQGNVMWSETGDVDGAYGEFLRLDDGRFLAGGYGDGVLLSLRNDVGEEMWTRDLDHGAGSSCSGLASDGTGGVLVLATVPDAVLGFTMRLLEVDDTGTVTSTVELDGDEGRIGLGLASRAGGGCFVLTEAGSGSDPSAPRAQAVLVDAAGAVVRTITFESEACESGSASGSILGLSDGGAAVVYSEHGCPGDPVRSHVVRLTAAGDEVWTWSVDLPGLDHLALCDERPDGSILLVGGADDGDDHSTTIIRLDADGEVLRRVDRFGFTESSYLNAGFTAWDGGVFAAGTRGSYLRNTARELAVRVDADWEPASVR